MKTNYTLKEFDKALAKDEQLKKTFLETCQKIADAGEASSDGEVVKKAAEEMGYQLSLEEIEREAASGEELNDDELEQVTGGAGCLENLCIVMLNCYVTMLHTDLDGKNSPCYSDYRCVFADKDIIISTQ